MVTSKVLSAAGFIDTELSVLHAESDAKTTFSREYELQAVKRVKERGIAVAHAARDLEFTRMLRK